MFLLVLFGILEYGLLFRDNLTTNNASQEGARAASVGGKASTADYLTLETIEHGIAAMGLERLNYVVVYNATVIGYDLPEGHLCHTQSTADCNRYVAADFAAVPVDGAGDNTGLFGCVGSDAIDSGWCPTTRRAGLGDDSDLVGVYVNTTHDYLTGFFGETQTLDATTVIRVEPDEDT